MAWWGPLAGAVGGTLLSWLGGKSGSKKDKPKQLPTMNPEQQKLLSDFIQRTQGLGQGFDKSQQYLTNFLDPNSQQYKNFEAPYLREYQEKYLPRLAEQYAGSGGGLGGQGGALSSSGFAQALGGGAAGLTEQLARLKSGLQYNAASDLMRNYQGMAGTALGKQTFDYQDRGPSSSTSFLGSLAQNLTPGVIGGVFDQISGIGGSTGNRSAGVFNNPYAYANNARWQ